LLLIGFLLVAVGGLIVSTVGKIGIEDVLFDIGVVLGLIGLLGGWMSMLRQRK
jgi:hypothetical protein